MRAAPPHSPSPPPIVPADDARAPPGTHPSEPCHSPVAARRRATPSAAPRLSVSSSGSSASAHSALLFLAALSSCFCCFFGRGHHRQPSADIFAQVWTAKDRHPVRSFSPRCARGGSRANPHPRDPRTRRTRAGKLGVDSGSKYYPRPGNFFFVFRKIRIAIWVSIPADTPAGRRFFQPPTRSLPT